MSHTPQEALLGQIAMAGFDAARRARGHYDADDWNELPEWARAGWIHAAKAVAAHLELAPRSAGDRPEPASDTTPAEPDQIRRALDTADGVLALADRTLDPAERAASDAEITAALRGETTFDEAVAAGLARVRDKYR